MAKEFEKRLISFNEARARYGISRQTIYRSIARNDLRLIKIGRSSRIDMREADHFFGLAGTCAV